MDIDIACACECDECWWHGDPHFTTFDDLIHHYQGECSYKYVSPCENDYTIVPFEIIGRHEECYMNGRSCMKELLMRLFNNNGILEEEILLQENYIEYAGLYSLSHVSLRNFVF